MITIMFFCYLNAFEYDATHMTNGSKVKSAEYDATHMTNGSSQLNMMPLTWQMALHSHDKWVKSIEYDATHMTNGSKVKSGVSWASCPWNTNILVCPILGSTGLDHGTAVLLTIRIVSSYCNLDCKSKIWLVLVCSLLIGNTLKFRK